MIPVCVWWTVGKKRNRTCFEGSRNSVQKAKMNCFSLFFAWCKEDILNDAESLINVIESLKEEQGYYFVSFEK